MECNEAKAGCSTYVMLSLNASMACPYFLFRGHVMLSYSSSRGVWVFSATLQVPSAHGHNHTRSSCPRSDAHVLSHYRMDNLALVVALVAFDNVLP